jgi:hypothetical protein
VVVLWNIWTQIWVRTEKNKPMPATEDEKAMMGYIGELKVNDRIWLSGGYDPYPEWLQKSQGYSGTVKFSYRVKTKSKRQSCNWKRR